MKALLILIFTIVPFLSYSQEKDCEDCEDYANTYVGATLTTDYIGLSITSEIEYDFIVLSLQTNINSVDPTFKGRLGLQVGNELKFVMFLPIMNYSLKEYAYNTPPVVELRYKPTLLDTKFMFCLGGEFYKNTAFPYLTVSIPFK